MATIMRVSKNKNYTIIYNPILDDKNLSCKAKGLLCWVLSRPDNWDFSIRGMEECLKEGREAISSMLRELEKFGYLTRETKREHGKFTDVLYTFRESPELKPCTENPDAENKAQINTNKTNTNNLNKKTLNKSFSKEKEASPQKINYSILKRQIRKLCTEMGKEKVFCDFSYEVISKYFHTYQKYRGENHTKLSNSSMKAVLMAIEKFGSKICLGSNNSYDEIMSGLYENLMEDYFSSAHSKDIDFHITHFTNENVLDRLYKRFKVDSECANNPLEEFERLF